MFIAAVNTPFNNALFSAGTIVSMHKTAERLYLAAAELKRLKGQSQVARLLNESPQTIKNWETRGVSRPGAIKAQAVIGCSATWLLDGSGPMRASSPPTGSALGEAFYEVVLPEDRAFLDDLHLLLPAEREQIMADVRAKAEQMREYLAQYYRDAGLPVPKSAAERARARSAIASATPTGQRPLFPAKVDK
jgi:hypothetical protein